MTYVDRDCAPNKEEVFFFCVSKSSLNGQPSLDGAVCVSVARFCKVDFGI